MALTADDIRELVKDKPELNILLEYEEQSEDSLINMAMKLAVSDYNSMPPGTRYTVESFPNDAILIYGVQYHLAMGEAEKQLRNQVNYNAQGLSVNLDDKYNQYMKLAQFYQQIFIQRAKAFKHHMNIENGWGHISSPYSTLNEYNFGP